MLGAETWEQSSFPAENSLTSQGQEVSSLLSYSCGNRGLERLCIGLSCVLVLHTSHGDPVPPFPSYHLSLISQVLSEPVSHFPFSRMTISESSVFSEPPWQSQQH